MTTPHTIGLHDGPLCAVMRCHDGLFRIRMKANHAFAMERAPDGTERPMEYRTPFEATQAAQIIEGRGSEPQLF